jgi:hypothetical protein
MKEHRLQLLVLLGITMLVLWPGPFGEGYLGHPLSDMPDHVQGSWWWGGLVHAWQLPVLTTNSHLPAGQPLWYVDPVGAFIAALLRPIGFRQAYNLALVLEVFLAGALLYRLAWRRLEQRWPALLAGTVGVSAPYLLGLVHSGLNEYLGLFFPVVLLGDALDALEGRGRAWLGVAIGVALCGVQALYYSAFAALLLLCLLVGTQPLQRARRLLPSLGLGLLLTLPLAWHVLGGMLGGQGAVDAATAPGWQQPSLPATDLSLFLRPGAHYFPDTPALGNPGILQVHYLGWIAMALAVYGFLRHQGLRRHRWAALCFAVFALGPALAWWGRPVVLGEGALPLPLAVLYRIPGSPWSLVHHPYRLTAFVIPLLGLGAAAAVSLLPRWVAWVAMPLVLAESLLVSPAVWPLPVTPAAAPAVYAALPSGGGVFDWPPDSTTWNRRYQLAQVEHGRAIPYGVNVFLREPLMRDPLVAELLEQLADPRARVRNRDVPGDARFPAERPGGWSSLGEIGLRWLVLHHQAMEPGELAATREVLEAWLGEPALQEGEAEVWAIPLETVSRSPVR